MSISARDLKIFDYLAKHQLVSQKILSARFFGSNPNNGLQNKNPVNAARRRLSELRKQGLVSLERIMVPPNGTRTIVCLTKAGIAASGNTRRVGAVNRGARSHHLLALEAAERFCKANPSYKPVLEHELRREAASKGKLFVEGIQAEVLPDAELRGPDGERVALEFVTSKYSSTMILEKKAGFGNRFNNVIWVADKDSTAERVKRITGESCSVV